MMAPAQLGNRPVAAGKTAGVEQVVTRSTRLVRLTARTRSLPAPPVPVPPAVPAVRRQQVTAPAHRRMRASAVRPAKPVRSPALRSARVASLVAAVMVTLAVVGGLSWLGQAASPGVPAHTAVIRVGAGETVWDVAARVAPRSDQRGVVERIRQLNRMVDSAIQPGQQLQVPDGR